MDPFGVVATPLDPHNNLVRYLHHLSGQDKDEVPKDHSYAKAWNRHPDPNIRARPAKFLFMKDFPRHITRKPRPGGEDFDVDSIDDSPYESGENPLITEINALSLPVPSSQSSTSDEKGDESIVEKCPPDKINWTPMMFKLWAKAIRILNVDRLARLASEGRSRDIVIRRNVMEKTAKRLRQMFAGLAQWDSKLLEWLHQTLHNHLSSVYVTAYHDAMQILRQKAPILVDKFYQPLRTEQQKTRMIPPDPVQTVLNNHRPNRINGSPLFLIVPNGPQIPHHFTSQRMKHWNNLFASLGRAINVTVSQKPNVTTSDCLMDIRLAVRDKIRECKATFTNDRPLVILGFGASSLIAAHAALDHANHVTATICVGFPLTGINGFRGDLDDPLLETSVPTLFVIGQNSSMCTLDDMEDFRERMTKAITGLIVVGGCNDRLILCGSKKKFEEITQGMVDRCIADEIYDFVSHVVNPNYADRFPTPKPIFRPAASAPLAAPRSTPLTSTPKTSPLGTSASSVLSRPQPLPSASELPPVQSSLGGIRNSLGVPGVVKRKRKYPRIRGATGKPSPIGGSISAPPTVPSSPDPPAMAELPLPPPPTIPEVPPAEKPKSSKSPAKKARLSQSESKTLTAAALSDALSAVSSKVTASDETSVDTAGSETENPVSDTPTSITATTSSTTHHYHSSDIPQYKNPERILNMSYGEATVNTVLSTSSTRTGRTIKAPKTLDI